MFSWSYRESKDKRNKHKIWISRELNRESRVDAGNLINNFNLLPNSNNISLSALAFGNKKDNPVYISQESGVIGLNFHQSKEVLISDNNGSTYGVSLRTELEVEISFN